MKAPKTALERLHNALAEQMLAELENSETPLSAAHWSAIAKFLKDNGIDSLGGLGDGSDDAFQLLAERARAAINSIHN